MCNYISSYTCNSIKLQLPKTLNLPYFTDSGLESSQHIQNIQHFLAENYKFLS